MKSLKFYFLASLVWASAGLFLVSCSDKENNGHSCQPGMVIINGHCQWAGNGGYGPYYQGKIGFGRVTDGSKFRDFTSRYTGMRYYYGGWGNNQIQVEIRGNTIFLRSPEISSGVIPLNGQRFDDGTRKKYEIYHNNPRYYKIAELVFTSGTMDSGTFEIRYFKNANGINEYTVIATGQMNNGQALPYPPYY